MNEIYDLLVDDFYEEFEYTPEFDAVMKKALTQYAETFVLLLRAERGEEIH